MNSNLQEINCFFTTHLNEEEGTEPYQQYSSGSSECSEQPDDLKDLINGLIKDYNELDYSDIVEAEISTTNISPNEKVINPSTKQLGDFSMDNLDQNSSKFQICRNLSSNNWKGDISSFKLNMSNNIVDRLERLGYNVRRSSSTTVNSFSNKINMNSKSSLNIYTFLSSAALSKFRTNKI